jgi:hypothetical protein
MVPNEVIERPQRDIQSGSRSFSSKQKPFFLFLHESSCKKCLHPHSAECTLCTHSAAIASAITAITDTITGEVRSRMVNPINSIRYSDYRVHKDRLYGEGQWEVFPIDFGGFVTNLMRVTSEAQIPAFARAFGFLGYHQLRANDRISSTRQARSNPKQLFEHLTNFRPNSEGEPLRWILAHARTMQRVLHTDTRLKEFRDRGDVARLCEIRQIWKDGPFALRGELRDESVLFRTPFRHATVQWGLFAIEEFLDGNIRGLYPRVAFAVDGTTSIDLRFSAPIEGAYFQLLQDLIRSQIKICKTCHEIFRTNDSRSEHCSKRHRNKFATRNFRARNKASSAKRTRKA